MGAVILALIYAAIPVGIVVVMVLKYREVRRAQLWLTTAGTVVTSTVASRILSPSDPGYNPGDTNVTNEPRVEYEYTVAGKKYRGRRIDLGEKTSSYELESILDRYPLGMAVTVYYDPADPNTAVLDRDMAWWVWAVGGGCVVLAIAAPLVAAGLYFYGVDWLKARLADPGRAPFVMALSGFGAVALLMTLGFLLYAVRAAFWPVARGRIVASGAQAYRDWQTIDRRRSRRTLYRSSVVYEYEVNGRTYRGDRVTLGVMSSTLPGFARRTAARYPFGSEVDVHYDPKRPSDSVLRPVSAMYLILFAAVGAVLWLAWAVATGRL
jgi:hypothetical protein